MYEENKMRNMNETHFENKYRSVREFIISGSNILVFLHLDDE